MANITFAQNPGTGIIVGGNAYTYTGTTLGTPTDNIANVEYTGIGGLTYTYADPQGKTVYTECERNLASYEYGPRGAQMDTNTTDERYFFKLANSAPTVDDDVTEGFYTNANWLDSSTGKLYNCSNITEGAAVWTWRNTKGTLEPCDWGVIRLGGTERTYWYVNGVYVIGIGFSTSWITETEWRGINLTVGDKIGARKTSSTASGNRCYYSFLPYTNP